MGRGIGPSRLLPALVERLRRRPCRLRCRRSDSRRHAADGRRSARVAVATVFLTISPPFQVGRSRSFTPGVDDVGHLLKFECQPVDAATGQPLASPTIVLIPQRIIAQPQPPQRRMVPIVPDAERVGRFTVLSYNVLADLYASVRAPRQPPLPPRAAAPRPLRPRCASPSASTFFWRCFNANSCDGDPPFFV